MLLEKRTGSLKKRNQLELQAIEFAADLKPGCEDWRILCELDKNSREISATGGKIDPKRYSGF